MSFKNCVIYQIFPERFHIGNSPTIEDKIKNNLYPEYAVAKKWDELPEISKTTQGFQFFGGDIDGIIEKLDYIKELGANCVYLTPVFPSNSNHKYDAISYTDVDKAFGGMSSFDRLITKAHECGIKICMDIALNHVSKNHPYFQQAIADPHSKYRDYFVFTDYPAVYNGWWGSSYLPELNYKNPEVIIDLITGGDSIIDFWVRKGIDAIRLDCANDLGPKLCTLIREKAKSINPDVMVFGEDFNYSAKWHDCLDGLQSYFYTSSIFSTLEGAITTRQFGKNISKLISEANEEVLLNSFNILSSHDYKRALTNLNGDIKKYFMALIMQFTLPGIPKIYYGEEVGMTGGNDPMNRAPMVWDESKWNNEIISFYKTLSHLRQTKKEFQTGKFMDFSEWMDNGVIGYMRYCEDDPKEYSIVLLNIENTDKNFRLFIPYSYIFCQLDLKNLLSDEIIKAEISYIDVSLKAMEYKIYSPHNQLKSNYSFFKRI